MDLQKEQDSDAHGSGWMLVICKHWNWNWHWDWKFYIFLTKDGDIVWVTALTKLRDLLTKWSLDICKPIPIVTKIDIVVTYRGGTLHLKPQDLLIMWSRDKRKKTFICTFTVAMVIELGRVVTYHWKNPHTYSSYLLIARSRVKCNTLYSHFCNI